jgi:glycosyltransferase involved in cell wall biosynthesis
MKNPKVTVLMSVYNGEKYLREAIDSILNQTFMDFEFLIINDGSTDSTVEILQSYDDPRIKIINNVENIGLTKSLNKGLRIARGTYIARMDCDDISLPERLEKQINYLNAHPEVGVLGTAYRLIDANGHDLEIMRMPINDLQIRWTSLFDNPFAHPTVMIRKNFMIKNKLNYDEAFLLSEDYDLWTRMLNYTRGMNLSEPLIQYRVHANTVTSKYREVQLKNRNIVALRTMHEQQLEYAKTSDQVNQLRDLFVVSSKVMPYLDAQRIALIENYLDMFEAFVSRHQGESGLKTLQRHEAVRVAYLILYSPLQPGWTRIVRRLMTRIDPGLPLSILGYLSSAVGRRLKRHLFNM